MIKKQAKELARGLFLKSQMSKKQIAAQVGVTEATMRKWVRDSQWDTQKEAETITRDVLLQDAYKQLSAVNKDIKENMNNIPDKKMSDVKATLRKEIEALSDNPLHIVVEVVSEFNAWLSRKYPKKLEVLVPLASEFIEKKAKENAQ